MSIDAKLLIVAGIDVGGARKGFHAVALRDGTFYDSFSSVEVADIVQWCCNTVHARVIGIDTPCRWSTDGRARPVERELMGVGIWCFSSPTRQMAVNHPRNHYGWMLNGEALFYELEKTHPLCCALPMSPGQRQCFETFPHAITCALSAGLVSAKKKRTIRRALLNQAGIDTVKLTNIDLVDAAMCALTAHNVASGKPCKSYGEPTTGLIIVPAPVNKQVDTNIIP